MKKLLLFIITLVLFSSCGTTLTDKERIIAHDSVSVLENKKEIKTTEEKSTLTCPECGFKQEETPPTDQCLIS